jgi:hypothetical protein
MIPLGSANFLFFDGETLFAHAQQRVFETPEGLSVPRPPGLCIRHFSREPDQPDWKSAGAHIADLPPRMILLASIPLNEEGWSPLPEGHALAMRDGALLHEAATV